MDQDRAKRKLTAIFSADVVGYSRLMEEDEAWTIQILEENKRLISGLVDEYEGRIVDAPGDNILAEFISVINAVECAIKIQQELKRKNDNLIESRKMHFRIGVNLGDVVEEDGRIYGNGVNIAARLEGLAEPGGICISRTAFDQINTKLDIGYEFLGEHNVKNITVPVRAYRLLIGAETAGKVIGEKKAPVRIFRSLAMPVIIVVIIIAAGLIVWNVYSHKSETKEQASEPEQTPFISDVEDAPKTIAVLPFDDLSPEKDQGYFVDGLSEEILNSLTKISNIRVIARTSSFSFKGTKKTVQEIANVLGADHVLEGSVRKAGTALRITAQLIQASDGTHLWSETYDRELKDIFVIQEDIAKAIAGELKSSLGIGKSLKQFGGTENEKAYEYYLLAKGQQYDTTALSRPLKSIDAAIAIDPEFARAWALKSTLHQVQSFIEAGDLADSRREDSLYAAQKAVALDPDLAAGYVSLGFTKMGKGEWIEAELAFHKAFELTDETLSSDDIFKTFTYYVDVGYFKKAVDLTAEWRQKDPLNASLREAYLLALSYFGDHQRAKEEFEYGRELFGDQWMGNFFYLMATMRHGIKITFDFDRKADTTVVGRVMVIGKNNFESPVKGLAELRQIYQDEKDLSSIAFYCISIVAAYLGDSDFAMDAMEKGNDINSGFISWAWLPVMKEVRQTPRFKKFISKIGLVDYWKQYGFPDMCRQLDNGDFECD